MANQQSYWINSGILTLMERMFMQIFALFSTMVLFRALPQQEIGHWATFLIVVTVVEVGRTGLLQNALVKYLTSAEGNEYRAINTASLYLNTLIGLIIAVCFLVFANPLSLYFEIPSMGSIFELYAINTILLTPLLQFNFIQQANLDFKGILWSSFIRQFVLFAYIILFFFLQFTITLPSLVMIRALGIGLGALVAWYFAKDYLKFDRKISWYWVKKLWNFGRYVMGTNLATMVFKGTDRLMVLKFFGDVQAGIFDSAIKVTNLAEAPTFSVASILFPQSAKNVKSGNLSIKILYEKAVGAILTVLVPAIIFVQFFADWIILIVAGEDYLEASNILRITMLYGIFVPFAVQFGTVLDSTGRPKDNFIFTVASVVVNLALNFFFVSSLGTIGAAYGTLVAYFLGFIAMQMYLYRVFGVTTISSFFYMVYFYGLIWRELLKFLLKKR